LVGESDRDLLDEGNLAELSPDFGVQVTECRECTAGPDLLLRHDHLTPLRAFERERAGGAR
jgi:hypothetical protein